MNCLVLKLCLKFTLKRLMCAGGGVAKTLNSLYLRAIITHIHTKFDRVKSYSFYDIGFNTDGKADSQTWLYRPGCS